MEHQDETFCAFCKKSASKLFTHSLCDCCLVHSKCCDATNEKSIPVVWEEDAVRKVECDICFEEYQENELQRHREMCMPRLVFRCSLCNEDYLSEESLWNHLIVHQIAYEDKELYYQEKRVTYKKYECILCNDQRSYQGSSYWEHVHEDHDGFYLRCSECGESFRSQKRKADHGLKHCKSREQITAFESGGSEIDVGYANINKHSSQENASEEDLEANQDDQQSLDGGLEMDVGNANIKKHASQENPSEEDFEANQDDEQSLLESESVESYGQDSTLVKDCDDGLTNDDADKDVPGKKSKKQRHVKNSSNDPSDLKCPQCDKEWSSAKALARHIENSHKPTRCDICGLLFSSAGRAKYHKARNHSQKKFQCPKCSWAFFSKYDYRRHLLIHQDGKYICETCNYKFRSIHSLEKHMKDFHRKKVAQTGSSVKKKEQSMAKTDCPICRDDFSDQSLVSQHVVKIHNRTICSICRLIFSNADELNNHECSMCPHCGKGFCNRTNLITHIKLCHEKTTCDVCDVSLPGKSKLLHHKLKVHSDPKFKCSQCSKKFHLKYQYTRHKSFCVKNESKFPCRLCDQKFDSFESVTTHLRIVHEVTRPLYDKKTNANLDMGQETENTIEMESIVDGKETSPMQSERGFAIEGDNDDDDVTHEDAAKKFHVKRAYPRRNKIGNVFPCKFCGRKFKSKGYVRKHIYRVHSVRKPPSQKGPNEQLALKMEISVEETQLLPNENQVPNADEGKSSSHPAVDNSSTHEKCPHCGQNFKKTYISRHIYDNHKRKCICKICGISFVKRHQLSYHVLVCHTDPKHKCPYCLELFHVRNCYDRHVATHEKHNA